MQVVERPGEPGMGRQPADLSLASVHDDEIVEHPRIPTSVKHLGDSDQGVRARLLPERGAGGGTEGVECQVALLGDVQARDNRTRLLKGGDGRVLGPWQPRQRQEKAATAPYEVSLRLLIAEVQIEGDRPDDRCVVNEL